MNNNSWNKLVSSTLTWILVLQLLLGAVFVPQPVYAWSAKPQKPEVPENIRAEATDTTITLYWDAVEAAKYYEININGGSKKNIYETEYTFKDLKPNTKYSIRIRTAGEKDKGEWSEKIEVTTLKKVKTPQIPRNLSAEAADSDINLSWDAAKDADSYDVEVNSSVVDNVTVTEYVYGDIEPETEYVFRVRAVNSGAKSGWSDELKVWVPKVYPAGTGNGLLGEYYDDINFRKLVFARVDPGIDFDWGFKAPGPGMDENSFSVRWTGQVQPRYSGKYTFYTYAGNGVRLWVDGKQIIDEWRLLFPRESKGTIELTAGEKYDIRLEYQDGLGEAGVVLSWSSGDQKKQVIPQEQLYCAPKAPGDISAVPHTTSVALNWNEAAGAESYDIDINGELISGVNGSEYLFENLTPDTVYTFKIRSVSSYGTSEWSKEVTVSTLEEQDPHAGNGNGLTGKYYDNIIFKKLIFERVDPTVDFDWGRGTPDPKIKGNTFSVRWEGILLPEYTAKHTLYLYSDDGARLWINGKERIDFWNPHSSKEGSAAIDLVAGEKYDIRIEYFNINKEAKVALYWSNVYEDKQIIPMEQLYTMPGVTSGPEIAPDVYEMTVTWSNTPGAEGYELEVDGAIVNVGLEAAYVHKGLEPNSQHTYRVRAVNELGKGGWSRTVTGLTLPDTPKNLASSSTSYAVALSWEAVPGAISYDIEADGNIIGSTPDTDYVHEGLQPVTEYTYRVRAVNASGAGYWSGPISELTKVGVPANINTVSASTAITFTWDADNEADSYEIELDGAMLDNGNNTAYEYTGLMPNSAHVYRLRAINELGCGDWSELRTKYTSPDIPRNITAASTGSGITLTWDAVEAAAGYDVEVQGSPVDNGNSTTYTHTDLDSNTQRTYRVRAKNEHGLGDWSGIIAKTTLSGVPVNLSYEPSETAISFGWDPVAGASTYDVEIDNNLIGDITNAEYDLTGLTPNSVHTFRVRSKNDDGISGWSEAVTASTLPAVPVIVCAEASADSVKTVWQSVYDTESYDIEVDGTVIDCGRNSEYIHQNLLPNTRHTYRVRARNEYNTGNWSGLIEKLTLPDAPRNLALEAGSSSVKLTWDRVDGAIEYEVEADGAVLAVVADNSYLCENIAPNTEHVYRVRAKSEAGAGNWSDEARTFTSVAVPQNITTFSSRDNIRLVWEEVYGVTGYEIEADGNLITIGTDGEYVHSGLMPNTTHIYRIRARMNETAGDWSEHTAATTLLASIAEVKAVSANTAISLSWTPVGDASGYNVEVDGNVVTGIPEPAYKAEGFIPNTPHTFRIMAKSENNMSDWSDLLTKYTTPDIPANITLFSTTSSITLTWEAVYDAAGYDVEVDGIVINNEIKTGYAHEGLTPNTQHNYRLRARNKFEASEWTAAIAGTTEPELTFNCEKDNLFNFVIAAPKLEEAVGRTITVTYDPEELEAVDLCAATAGQDITVGEITGTNLEIKEFTPGTIVFGLKDSGKAIMNAVKFKAKINGQSKILYVIE